MRRASSARPRSSARSATARSIDVRHRRRPLRRPDRDPQRHRQRQEGQEAVDPRRPRRRRPRPSPVADDEARPGARPTPRRSRRTSATSAWSSTPRTPRSRAGHFIKLAKAGVYDGSRWHRVVKDFVIQGGAPGGDPHEGLRHSPSSASCPKDSTRSASSPRRRPKPTRPARSTRSSSSSPERRARRCRPQYADFGTVTSGMDVVKKIEALADRRRRGEPDGKATIDKITINES